MNIVLAALVVAGLAVGALAQVTHTVGPGAFPQLDDALAVAASGDVIVVQPGTYEPFTATIGVTIRAATPGTVMIDVASGGPSLFLSSTVTLAATEVMHLVDLAIRVLTISGGTTTLDGCTIQAWAFWGTTALTALAGTVHLQACSLTGATSAFGYGAGLVATNTTTTAIDCTFLGGNVGSPHDGPPPGVAIRLQGSVFHGSHLHAQGGSGTTVAPYQPVAALRSINSIVWISDSTLTGGSYPSGARVCPVEATTGRLDRCTLVPATCTVGIPTMGLLLGLHRLSPMQSPGPFVLEFQTEANGFVAVYISASLGSLTLPLLEQPISLDAANVFPVACLFADAVGHATGTFSLPASVSNHRLWFQGVSGPAFPLQLSPVAGGVVR